MSPEEGGWCKGGIRNGMGEWVGGIPLIELSSSKIHISCFLTDIDPISKIFQELIRGISRIVRHAPFPNFSFVEILRISQRISSKIVLDVFLDCFE